VRFLTAFVSGLLFGAGLLLSGMANPQVVLGFLDIAGAWNPALMFTMAGAIALAAPACFYVRRGGRTLGGDAVELPNRTRITAALLGGAFIFGLGWGMSGICPGPGLLLVTGASPGALVFIVAMLAGMALARGVTRRPATVGAGAVPARPNN
jgi:uncharacterized membrane protein YedE/YeeE